MAMPIGISNENKLVYQYLLFEISLSNIVCGGVAISSATRSSMIYDFGFT